MSADSFADSFVKLVGYLTIVIAMLPLIAEGARRIAIAVIKASVEVVGTFENAREKVPF